MGRAERDKRSGGWGKASWKSKIKSAFNNRVQLRESKSEGGRGERAL